jgi:hypothetical protein
VKKLVSGQQSVVRRATSLPRAKKQLTTDNGQTTRLARNDLEKNGLQRGPSWQGEVFLAPHLLFQARDGLGTDHYEQ